MTDTEARADLIARLEAAPVGSRDLDCDIALALGWTYEKRSRDRKRWWREPDCERLSSSEYASHLPNQKFSTSLDAKLPGENIIYMYHDAGIFVAIHWEPGGMKRFRGEAATEPLARRIAALKARQA